MGVCGSKGQGKKKEDRNIEPQEIEEQGPVKLLLLGAGETGKSTLFKQIGLLYGLNPVLQNGDDIRKIIRQNIVDAMSVLARHADMLDESFSTRITSEAAKAAKTELLSMLMCWDNNHSGDNLESDHIRTMVLEDLKTLWVEPGIRKALTLKSMFNLSFDNLPYFMEKVDEVFTRNYSPSVEDVLRCRTRTTGINEIQFDMDATHIQELGLTFPNLSFRLIDVGGQRGERRKWLRFLDNIDGIIFMSAISGYDEKMFEDENSLRLNEDLAVFADVCKNSWSKKVSVLLLLNKKDVFQNKFNAARFKQVYPQFQGATVPEACEFLKKEFESKNTRRSCDVTTKVTSVLDAEEVSEIFSHLIKEVFTNSQH
jgi:GTPase SAR1 family protein